MHGGFLGRGEKLGTKVVSLYGFDEIIRKIQRSTERDVVAGSVGAPVQGRGLQDYQRFGPNGQVLCNLLSESGNDEGEY